MSGSSKDALLVSEIERLKGQHSIDINKLELYVAELENKLTKVKHECSKYEREAELSKSLAERCAILEKDSEQWISERDKLIAKYTTAIEMMKKEYEAELHLATETLTAQLQAAVLVGEEKQKEIEVLMVKLE